MLDLGTSPGVANTNGQALSVIFAPAVGGPVTLTAGTLTIDPRANLTGTDNFAADGMLTLAPTPSTARSSASRAPWTPTAGLTWRLRHHPGHHPEQPRRRHARHRAAHLAIGRARTRAHHQQPPRRQLHHHRARERPGLGNGIVNGDGSAVAFNNSGTLMVRPTLA